MRAYVCVCVHPCTHSQWGNNSPWWFRTAYKAHLQLHTHTLLCHALTFQNPYAVTDMRHQLLCCTCEFNRGKFRRDCSNLPVYFHQRQHHHVNSFPKLVAKLDFSKWVIESPGCRQAWWTQVLAWKWAPLNAARATFPLACTSLPWCLVLTLWPSQSSCPLLSQFWCLYSVYVNECKEIKVQAVTSSRPTEEGCHWSALC